MTKKQVNRRGHRERREKNRETLNYVIPAKAGIQKPLEKLDARLRGHDEATFVQNVHKFLLHSIFLCVICVLCGKNAFAVGEDGAELMAQLQARLLNARRVVIEGDIQSRGALFSQLKGGARINERNHMSLSYNGQFGPKPAALSLAADGRLLELRNGAGRRVEPVPDEANRALLIGLLRMGLLHNLARLTRLQAPDHGGGGVERWLTLDNFRPTTYILGGELEGALSFGFDVLVNGEPAASARLWLDPVSGLPRRREQTVNFPAGEMTVVENYARFVVE